MKEIIQKENKVLRKIAKEIPITNISTPKIKKVIKEMSLALLSQDDGVAIAAPQIGYSLRIFIISGKVFDKDFLEERKNKTISKKERITPPDMIFINPVIVKISREKEEVPEGCLSVRWLYGKTKRAKKATVEAYDENGKRFKVGGSGLLAQIFQHEIDHLNGILFTDHAKDIKEELPPKEL